jgi:hypothetical protein
LGQKTLFFPSKNFNFLEKIFFVFQKTFFLFFKQLIPLMLIKNIRKKNFLIPAKKKKMGSTQETKQGVNS